MRQLKRIESDNVSIHDEMKKMMELEEEIARNEKRFDFVLRCMVFPLALIIVCNGIKIYYIVTGI